MKPAAFFILLLIGLSVSFNAAFAANTIVTNELGQGVIYKRYHYDSLYSAKQEVYVVDVNLNDPAPSIQFPYRTGGATRTVSQHAATVTNAVACVNAQYFNSSGSISFFRVNGTTINPTAAGVHEHQALINTGTKQAQSIGITVKPTAGWSSVNASNIMACGPQLITAGVKRTDYDMSDNLVYARHPRTAVAWTYDNHLLFVVVDGRSDDAAGMTLPELRDYVYSLASIRNAFNLDGGGSTTMWAKVNGVGEVKNVPSSSNAQQRPVVNAIAITTTPVTIPLPPANITPYAYTNSVVLTWPASVGATSYNIRRAPAAGGSYVLIGNSTSAGFTNGGMTAGTSFRYVVSAINSAGESSNSAPITVNLPCPTLSAPSGLTALLTNGFIRLNWNVAANAYGYILNRATSSGGSYLPLATGLSGTNYVDTTALEGVVYFYTVSATNACGTIVSSGEVSAPFRLMSPVSTLSNIVLQGWGGKPGATFYLLSSTNVALPSSNWIRLSTNTFQSNGFLSVTNPINPTLPSQFFKIQSTQP